MSIFHVIHIISRVYMSIFGKHTNNFVLLLLYSIIIDIFSLTEARRFYRIWVVAAGSLRGAKQRGNLMSLRKHYEVTTLYAIVRDELHPPRLPSTRETRLVNYPG